MPLPLFTRLTAFVTKPKAVQINDAYDVIEKIAMATLLADYAAAETLSATKTLSDADNPFLIHNPSGADQIVKLPPEASTNHAMLIYNAGSTYNLIVKDDSGTTIITTLAPGQSSMFVPTGSAWIIGIDAGSDGKYYGRKNGAWAGIISADKGFIHGLNLTYVSATAIDIETGVAYVESLDRVVKVTTTISKTGLSLSASTWYHVYLYESGGNPAVEVVTTAPASPYFGKARSKTGDTSRRYLGSIRTDASGNIYKFVMSGNTIQYVATYYSEGFRVLSSGSATTLTSVSISSVAPVTASYVLLWCVNNSASAQFNIFDSAGKQLFTIVQSSRVGTKSFHESLTIYYSNTTTGGNANIDVYGYDFER